MDNLIEKFMNIRNQIKPLINKRIIEFENLGKNGTEYQLFSELCFCVMTANWSSKGAIKAQKLIGENNFAQLPLDKLKIKFKEAGHRFPNARSEYVVKNRWVIGELRNIISLPYKESREFLANNIKGIGWKESSHFLRNIGIFNVAILDKHILRIMLRHSLIKEIPKSGWNQKRYIDYENKFIKLSNALKEKPGIIDLYLWFMVKGSVDK